MRCRLANFSAVLHGILLKGVYNIDMSILRQNELNDSSVSSSTVTSHLQHPVISVLVPWIE